MTLGDQGLASQMWEAGDGESFPFVGRDGSMFHVVVSRRHGLRGFAVFANGVRLTGHRLLTRQQLEDWCNNLTPSRE